MWQLALVLSCWTWLLAGNPSASAPSAPGAPRHRFFGQVVGAVGDVDGDGRADCLLGDPAHPLGGRGDEPAEFWIVSGCDGSTIHHWRIAKDVSASYRALGGRDLDGDGVPDVVIASLPRGLHSRLHVFSGRSGAELRTIETSAPAWPRHGAEHWVGDRDGDGRDEIGILRGDEQQTAVHVTSCASGSAVAVVPIEAGCHGVPLGFREFADVDGNGTRDWVVFLDAADRCPATVRVHSSVDGAVLWEHAGPRSRREAFGQLVVIWDADGDSFPDLVASFHDSITVLSGLDGRPLKQFGRWSRPVKGETGFGRALALLESTSTDLGPCLVIAEPESHLTHGTVAAVETSWTSKRWSRSAIRADEFELGHALANLGDVDGDGIDDCAVATSNMAAAPPRAFILSGRDGHVLFEFTRKDDGSLGVSR